MKDLQEQIKRLDVAFPTRVPNRLEVAETLGIPFRATPEVQDAFVAWRYAPVLERLRRMYPKDPPTVRQIVVRANVSKALAQRLHALFVPTADRFAGTITPDGWYRPDRRGLVGPCELVPLFRVNRETVSRWGRRAVLPEPDFVPSGTGLWDVDTMIRLAHQTGRATYVDPAWLAAHLPGVTNAEKLARRPAA